LFSHIPSPSVNKILPRGDTNDDGLCDATPNK
jgi:hypothetical protein